ncbi:hypothetical protein F5Y06DRAFT_269010 [Hypoxylon sp. FL0890]|nr:hypothetical protein F5Y06DRAFT_269010 [Hypoxylon sp. FL0890]
MISLIRQAEAGRTTFLLLVFRICLCTCLPMQYYSATGEPPASIAAPARQTWQQILPRRIDRKTLRACALHRELQAPGKPRGHVGA